MSGNNRLKELRKKAGLTQEQLGEVVGCNKSKVSKLERGDQELTQSWMIRLSKALNDNGLNITPSDLLPLDQTHYFAEEEKVLNTLRALKEGNKGEFDAIMTLIDKNKK